MASRVNIPIYHKIWWEGNFCEDGTATMRLMAFNGKENLALETHRNVKVIIRGDINGNEKVDC